MLTLEPRVLFLLFHLVNSLHNFTCYFLNQDFPREYRFQNLNKVPLLYSHHMPYFSLITHNTHYHYTFIHVIMWIPHILTQLNPPWDQGLYLLYTPVFFILSIQNNVWDIGSIQYILIEWVGKKQSFKECSNRQLQCCITLQEKDRPWSLYLGWWWHKSLLCDVLTV